MEELLIKLAEANAKTLAWVNEDPNNRWAGLYSLDADHWIERGIHNLEEFDRMELEEAYRELFKDVHGVRPQSVKEMPTEALEAGVKWLSEENDRQIEESRAREARNAEEFEARVESTMELVSGTSRARAIEIIAEAEGLEQDYKWYGAEALEYHFRLPYGYIKKETA